MLTLDLKNKFKKSVSANKYFRIGDNHLKSDEEEVEIMWLKCELNGHLSILIFWYITINSKFQDNYKINTAFYILFPIKYFIKITK